MRGPTPWALGLMPMGMKKEPTAWPWGGDGGKPWDDGVFTGIKKIFLTKGDAIYAIQIEYDRNGQSIWAAKHGGNNEGSCHVVIIVIIVFPIFIYTLLFYFLFKK